MSCHHVFMHFTSICVDCSVLSGVLNLLDRTWFEIETSPMEDRWHRRTTMDYGSTSQWSYFPRCPISKYCQARQEITYPSVHISSYPSIFSTIILHSILETTFCQCIEYPMNCMFPTPIHVSLLLTIGLMCWPVLIHTCCMLCLAMLCHV